ncbi:MAG TPA: hypothetical protein VK956_12780 [Verrucomicrobium sp.]|nr:hypothetical protein [Verrucomicrobium sp.]
MHLEPGSFCEPALSKVKAQKYIYSQYLGGGNVQEVYGSLSIPSAVILAQFVRRTEHLCPRQRMMDEQSVFQIFVQLPESQILICGRDCTAGRCVSDGIANLNPMQWGEYQRSRLFRHALQSS